MSNQQDFKRAMRSLFSRIAPQSTRSKVAVAATLICLVIPAFFVSMPHHATQETPAAPVSHTYFNYTPSAATPKANIATAVSNPSKKSAKPMTMGGYKETYEAAAVPREAKDEQARYLKEKAELDAAIKNSTNPRIQAFADMIEQARKVTNELTRVEDVQAFVNITIHNDPSEATNGKTNAEELSMRGVLEAGMGACEQSAWLKMYAIQQLGITDVQFIAEKSIAEGKPDTGHGITIVRINDNTYALNDQSLRDPNKSLSREEAKDIVPFMSAMELASTHLNNNSKSLLADKKQYYIPFWGFDPDQAFSIINSDSTVPEAARTAPAGVERLKDSTVQPANVTNILNSAFSANFNIVDQLPPNPVTISNGAAPVTPKTKKVAGMSPAP